MTITIIFPKITKLQIQLVFRIAITIFQLQIQLQVKQMSTPLIQINGKCEVPFYFVCICQKCFIICV